jgi:amidase
MVRDAEPGDTLVVSVEGIKLGSKGYWAVRQDMGILKDLVREPSADVVEVRGSYVLAGGIGLPVRPMIGTIGVAPSSGSIAPIHPGPHGGNMDCNDISTGAKLLLPVNVRGALLSLGDVHATMGDGEVTGGGVEIGADVRVRIELLKGVRVPCPMVETDSAIVVIKDGAELTEAIRSVVLEAATLVSTRLGVSFEDGYRIASVSGDLRICQAAGLPINAIVRMRLPKLFSLLTYLGSTV